ncbi:ribosomal protein L5 [Peniophora sp. CONT]|nr:ribosomal protein L5 [Peniophora sp. CONT]
MSSRAVARRAGAEFFKTRRAQAARRLPRDEQGLPIPRCDIVLRDTHESRLGEHYYHTLQDDLMYMTYVHEAGPRPAPRQIRLLHDPENPYTKHRTNPVAGGSRLGRKPAAPTTDENVVQLDRIQIHTMVKDAMLSKANLLGPMMVLRALSGETQKGGGTYGAEGVEIVKGIKNVSGWVRTGQPIGVKVDMKGPKMYEFLATLTEFVLPRLREFPGLLLPPQKASLETPAGVSGTVSMGLTPQAMAFFPQIEVNLDAYPKSYGMHIHFITNARGAGAQNKARQLLSGFQIPFSRR